MERDSLLPGGWLETKVWHSHIDPTTGRLSALEHMMLIQRGVLVCAEGNLLFTKHAT
jgi:hypothetical protein